MAVHRRDASADDDVVQGLRSSILLLCSVQRVLRRLISLISLIGCE